MGPEANDAVRDALWLITLVAVAVVALRLLLLLRPRGETEREDAGR